MSAQISRLVHRRALIEAAAVFAVVLAFMRWKIGAWAGFADFDGHYHLKVAQWIAHQGFWADIPWLPFTVLGERGPDHHWLWHLMLVPFTAIGDPGEALVWAAAVNGAAPAAVIAYVLRILGVPAAPLFALLAIGAGAAMPYRLMMLRAQNIALVYMALALWAAGRGRWVWLGAIAFLFLESYHAAVILGPLALLACAAHSHAQRRFVLTPLIAVGAGLTLALALSPWFPRNVEYLMFHTLFKTRAPTHEGQLSSLIGTEWYPASWREILLECWPAHAVLLAAAALLAWRRARPAPETTIAAGMALLSLGLYAYAVRFAEYYIPFAVIAAGLALRDSGLRFGIRSLAACVVALVPAMSVGAAGATPAMVMQGDYLQRIGAALRESARSGEMVFNSSWSDFMALVWWADNVRYVNGLDGHYLAYRDPARFALWLSVSAGRTDDPAGIIEAAFGARHVVVARQHGGLAHQLLNSDRALLRVDSPEGWLFELVSAKAVPAPEGKRIPQSR
ncbi:MAG: hypothetical protein ACT4P4_24605 [Betaproteobacteria bacterium]